MLHVFPGREGSSRATHALGMAKLTFTWSNEQTQQHSGHGTHYGQFVLFKTAKYRISKQHVAQVSVSHSAHVRRHFDGCIQTKVLRQSRHLTRTRLSSMIKSLSRGSTRSSTSCNACVGRSREALPTGRQQSPETVDVTNAQHAPEYKLAKRCRRQ